MPDPITAIVGGSVLGAAGSVVGASKASKASKSAAETQASAGLQAAEIQAASQREQLEYLKEREAIPQQFREEALTQLGGLAGLEGGEGTQQQLIGQARMSPLYQELMGTIPRGEEAILRQASATGGLRSGNVQAALGQYAPAVERQALTQAYNQQLSGIQGLANLPSGAAQIGQAMASIGATQAAGISAAGQARAQGKVASGQAWQQGLQGVTGAIGSGVGNYLSLI